MKTILNREFSLINYPKIIRALKEGNKLFFKYNYYFLIFAFIILYFGSDITMKLDDLNNLYNDDDIGYKNFIDVIQNCIICIYVVLSCMYIYTLFSYMFYNLENKFRKINYHPLIINIAYFIILAFELQSNKTDQEHAIIMIAVDLMVLIILMIRKKSLYIITKPFMLILKVFFLMIIAFLVINIKYVVLTFELLKEDINISLKKDANMLLKKQNFLIKDSYFDMKNNNLHIILKIKDNKTE